MKKETTTEEITKSIRDKVRNTQIFEKGYCSSCNDTKVFQYIIPRYIKGQRYDFYMCQRCGDIKEIREIKLSVLEK